MDIWSSGITLFAMLSGFLPFDEDSKSVLYQKIAACKYKIPKHFSSEAGDLVRRILVNDTNKRLSIDEIKQHPWMQSYKKKNLIPEIQEISKILPGKIPKILTFKILESLKRLPSS